MARVALAAGDGFDAPEWVRTMGRAAALDLRPRHGADYGRLIVAEAPPVCAQHGVYFEPSMPNR